MSDLRKAAEMALEALETLWDILDDIDTASDMAKENDAWYRKRVEALQKKRWDTMITTDGYKLKDGPVEALRQALAQPVDAVNTTQERVDETAKREHEPVEYTGNGTASREADVRPTGFFFQMPKPVAWMNNDYEVFFDAGKAACYSMGWIKPLYTAPPKREWVGLTDEEARDISFNLPIKWTGHLQGAASIYDFARAIEAKLKEKNT